MSKLKTLESKSDTWIYKEQETKYSNRAEALTLKVQLLDFSETPLNQQLL